MKLIAAFGFMLSLSMSTGLIHKWSFSAISKRITRFSLANLNTQLISLLSEVECSSSKMLRGAISVSDDAKKVESNQTLISDPIDNTMTNFAIQDLAQSSLPATETSLTEPNAEELSIAATKIYLSTNSKSSLVSKKLSLESIPPSEIITSYPSFASSASVTTLSSTAAFVISAVDAISSPSRTPSIRPSNAPIGSTSMSTSSTVPVSTTAAQSLTKMPSSIRTAIPTVMPTTSRIKRPSNLQTDQPQLPSLTSIPILFQKTISPSYHPTLSPAVIPSTADANSSIFLSTTLTIVTCTIVSLVFLSGLVLLIRLYKQSIIVDIKDKECADLTLQGLYVRKGAGHVGTPTSDPSSSNSPFEVKVTDNPQLSAYTISKNTQQPHQYHNLLSNSQSQSSIRLSSQSFRRPSDITCADFGVNSVIANATDKLDTATAATISDTVSEKSNVTSESSIDPRLFGTPMSSWKVASATSGTTNSISTSSTHEPKRQSNGTNRVMSSSVDGSKNNDSGSSKVTVPRPTPDSIESSFTEKTAGVQNYSQQALINIRTQASSGNFQHQTDNRQFRGHTNTNISRFSPKRDFSADGIEKPNYVNHLRFSHDSARLQSTNRPRRSSQPRRPSTDVSSVPGLNSNSQSARGGNTPVANKIPRRASMSNVPNSRPRPRRKLSLSSDSSDLGSASNDRSWHNRSRGIRKSHQTKNISRDLNGSHEGLRNSGRNDDIGSANSASLIRRQALDGNITKTEVLMHLNSTDSG